MISRTALLIVSLVCLWSIGASAATVDQSIYTELSKARDGEMVKVLMLMDFHTRMLLLEKLLLVSF